MTRKVDVTDRNNPYAAPETMLPSRMLPYPIHVFIPMAMFANAVATPIRFGASPAWRMVRDDLAGATLAFFCSGIAIFVVRWIVQLVWSRLGRTIRHSTFAQCLAGMMFIAIFYGGLSISGWEYLDTGLRSLFTLCVAFTAMFFSVEIECVVACLQLELDKGK